MYCMSVHIVVTTHDSVRWARMEMSRCCISSLTCVSPRASGVWWRGEARLTYVDRRSAVVS